jgi:transcriptional regulator with XRE-family HTH domain
MAKNFRQLQAKMSPQSRRRSEAKAERMIREMALDELREARQLTQEQLAAQLKVRQPAVAKLERRADMYLSTLRAVIKAMGGELDVRAVFPNGSVRIKKLKEPRKRS